MKFHYDKSADALYIRLNSKRYVESDEVSPGLILDYDKSGNIIGIEVLEASKKIPKQFRSELKDKDLSIVFA